METRRRAQHSALGDRQRRRRKAWCGGQLPPTSLSCFSLSMESFCLRMMASDSSEYACATTRHDDDATRTPVTHISNGTTAATPAPTGPQWGRGGRRRRQRCTTVTEPQRRAKTRGGDARHGHARHLAHRLHVLVLPLQLLEVGPQLGLGVLHPLHFSEPRTCTHITRGGVSASPHAAATSSGAPTRRARLSQGDVTGCRSHSPGCTRGKSLLRGSDRLVVEVSARAR
jgi:hypothetical protein